jgi:hypothetical protein
MSLPPGNGPAREAGGAPPVLRESDEDEEGGEEDEEGDSPAAAAAAGARRDGGGAAFTSAGAGASSSAAAARSIANPLAMLWPGAGGGGGGGFGFTRPPAGPSSGGCLYRLPAGQLRNEVVLMDTPGGCRPGRAREALAGLVPRPLGVRHALFSPRVKEGKKDLRPLPGVR